MGVAPTISTTFIHPRNFTHRNKSVSIFVLGSQRKTLAAAAALWRPLSYLLSIDGTDRQTDRHQPDASRHLPPEAASVSNYSYCYCHIKFS